MLKKMKTRKGTDGYNYPYTHQDLIFNDEGTGLSQQLENFATKDFVNDMLSGLRLVQMTQSEYDALEVKDSNTLYIII